MTRRAALTPAQAAEIRRRLALWAANTPKRLASEFRVCRQVIAAVRAGKHKPQGWERDP